VCVCVVVEAEGVCGAEFGQQWHQRFFSEIQYRRYWVVHMFVNP
jgi:hypothetical protein